VGRAARHGALGEERRGDDFTVVRPSATRAATRRPLSTPRQGRRAVNRIKMIKRQMYGRANADPDAHQVASMDHADMSDDHASHISRGFVSAAAGGLIDA
jgi:transposase